jgi:hypothetical protein
MYMRFAAAGMHIVAANKKFGAGPLPRYNELMALCAAGKSQFLYEVSQWLLLLLQPRLGQSASVCAAFVGDVMTFRMPAMPNSQTHAPVHARSAGLGTGAGHCCYMCLQQQRPTPRRTHCTVLGFFAQRPCMHNHSGHHVMQHFVI